MDNEFLLDTIINKEFLEACIEYEMYPNSLILVESLLDKGLTIKDFIDNSVKMNKRNWIITLLLEFSTRFDKDTRIYIINNLSVDLLLFVFLRVGELPEKYKKDYFTIEENEIMKSLIQKEYPTELATMTSASNDLPLRLIENPQYIRIQK